jgi:Flp pilus assembly protein TadD
VIADTSRAMGIEPTYTAAYTIRGLAYQEKGDLVRARADYNKAIALPASRNDGEWAQNVARGRLKGLDAHD